MPHPLEPTTKSGPLTKQPRIAGCAPRPGELSPVQRELMGQGIEYELSPGERMYPAMTRECFGFVLSGQLDQSWKEGADVTAVTALGTGDWFGQSALFFGHTPTPVVLSATTYTRVLILDVTYIRCLLETNPSGLGQRLQREAMGYLLKRVVYLVERLHQRHHAETDTLVLEALREAATWPSAMSHPEGTLVNIQRQRLAHRVGCNRMTITRTLQRLSQAGKVRVQGRRILLIGQDGRGLQAA